MGRFGVFEFLFENEIIMNVVINALSARKGGGQTYLINLLKNVRYFKGEKIFLLAPASLTAPNHPKLKRVNVSLPTDNPLIRALVEKYYLPRLLKKLNTAVLFCPGGLINTKVGGSCKTVTMFRNMLPFDRQQREKYPYGLMRIRNWILKRVLLESMKKADLVIFISEYARQTIEKKTAYSLNNGVTIPHGISDAFKYSTQKTYTRPKWLPKGEYLLYVSVFEPYKNQLEVIKAFQLLKKNRKTKEKLLLVGSNKTEYGESVLSEISRLGLEADVICAGEINYAELPNVYYYAKLNIFASECENCPNILLEALGAGRPVLVSKRQPMPEFGGDSVVYFDASSPSDLARTLVDTIDDDKKKNELAEKAVKRAYCYDWGRAAEQTWNQINSLL
jgi:glycosyltransferase involved in cell wall biosynthesis